MYKVVISKEVSSAIESDYREQTSSTKEWAIPENLNSRIRIYESLSKLKFSLEENPFQYPELYEGYHYVVEVYLPYVLIYVIDKSEVKVIQVLKKSELF